MTFTKYQAIKRACLIRDVTGYLVFGLIVVLMLSMVI